MDTWKDKKYRNLFLDAGFSEAEIESRLEEIWNTFFYGSEDKRIYFPAGEDMGYLCDTGNDDARTEGMSYGMMICVQLDRKEEFDRIWKWSKTYMWMDEGENEGYFAWSCGLDGREGQPMWNHDNHQILFVPGSDFTDPSYHLPHFYELFALWADEEDRAFFKEAAVASREYLARACHPETGFSAEYAEFDGSPMSRKLPWTNDRHDWFYSDAYRTVANIGLDYEWFGIDCGQRAAADRIQDFLFEAGRTGEYHTYEVDGRIADVNVLHPVAITATVAQASLASENSHRMEWVERFFKMPLREGKRRYYDNCLYFFAFLALSGRYRIW